MARGLGLRARLRLMVLVALLPPTIIGAFVRFVTVVMVPAVMFVGLAVPPEGNV